MSEPEPSRLHMSTSMGMGGTLPPLSLPPLSLPPMKTDHLGLSPIGMPYSAYSQSLHSPSLASPSNHMNSSMSLSHAPSSPMGYTNGSSRQSSIKRRINPNDRMMVPQFQHPFHPPDRSLESHLNEPPIKQLKSVPGSPNIHSGPSTPSSLQMRFSMDSPSSSMGHSPLSMSSQPSTSQIPNGNGYPINYPQNPNVSAIPPIHMPPSSQAPQMAMQHPMFSIPNNRPPDYREQTGPSANGLIIMSQPGPSFQRPRMPSADYPQNGASYPDRTQQSTTISPQAVSSIHNFPSQMSPQQQHYPYPRVEPSLQRSMSLPTTTDQQTVQKVDQETKPVIQSPKPVVPQPVEQPKVQAKPAKTETLGQFQHKIEQHQLKPEQVAPRIASVEKKPVFQPTPEDSPEMSVPASPTKTELPPPTTPVATSTVIPQPLPEPQVLVQKPPPTEPPKTLEQRLAQPSTAIQSNGAPRPPLMHPILGRHLKLEEIKILRQRQILHKRLMEHKLKQLKGQIPGTSATSSSTARTISGLPLALQLRLKQSPKHQAMLQHRITQLQNQRAAAAAAASAPGPSGLQKPPQLPVLVPTILRKKPEQPPLSQSQIKQLLSERLKSPPGPPPPQSSSLQQMLAARSLQAPRILHPGQLIPAQLHPSQANMPVRSVLQAHQQQLIAGAPPRPGLGPVIVNPHIGHQVIPGLMVHPPKRDQTVSIQMAKLIDERMPQPIVSNKEQYRFFKKKMRFLVYENECYQEELRMLERKLLKLSRDKHYLLDRLLAYEKLSDESQDDSDSSQKTIDERPKAKKRNRNKGKKDSGSATRSASGTPSPSPSPAPQTLLAQMLQPSTSGLGTGKLHPDVKMEPKSPIYPSERKYSFDDSMRLTMPSTSSDYVYPGPSSAPIVTNFNPFDGAFPQDQPELFSELRNDSNGHPESFPNDSAPSTSYSPPTSPRINGSLPASPSDPSTSHTKKLDSDDRPV